MTTSLYKIHKYNEYIYKIHSQQLLLILYYIVPAQSIHVPFTLDSSQFSFY